MNSIHKFAKYLFALFFISASVVPTLAQPIFNVYSQCHMDNGTHHNYLCMQYDQDSEGYIQVLIAREDLYLGAVDASMYSSLADVGNKAKAIKSLTNVPVENAVFTVYRDDINPTGEPKTMTKTYYVQVCKAGTNECETTEMPFDTYHTQDVPEINIDPYCYGNTPASLTTTVLKYKDSDKYSWEDVKTGKKLGIGDFLTIGSLSPGEHKYKLQNRNGVCYSPGIEITLSVKSNDTPKLNNTYVTYHASDVSNGKYTKGIKDQIGNGDIVDNPMDCDLVWYDKDGNKIPDFDSYVPPVPAKPGVTIDEYEVTKDCGCRTALKYTKFYVMMYVLPKPTVSDLSFCVDDPRATNGFDAIIGQTTEIGEKKANYKLEFSENADMSGAIALDPGIEHFDYTFDVSTPGVHKYYVRQLEVSTGEYSEIVPFEVTVSQPSAPTLTNKNVCLNSEKTVSLSSLSGDANLIWKDANDRPLSGSVTLDKRGDISVYAQAYEMVDGQQCLSSVSSATIHADSIEVLISGDFILLPGQTGKSELSIKGSGSQTIEWSSPVAGSIIGDVNKDNVTVKMGSLSIPLTATVTDGVCSESVNWTIQADLFQCPSPSADDISLCINDPRAMDGFDAKITLENTSDNKSNYVLSISPNSDMSGATTLAPGETHFDYTFDVSAVGTKKIYIQQTELSRNLSSAIVPVTITVKQPAVPSTSTTTICLNDETEIQLSKLSSESNLQWYDKDKIEIATTGHIANRGKHTFYAKRYELVNGQKCWSDFNSVVVSADSVGVKIDGDNHLCPNGEGNVTIAPIATGFDKIKWSSNVTNTISNATSPTVNVKMGESDLRLEYEVSAGVCKTTGSWNITVGTGIVSGSIKFTEGDKVRESASLTNVEYSSCGGEVSVEATVVHSSTDFIVRKGTKTLGTYSFAGDLAKFVIEGAGTYSVVYENDCETSFSFVVTVMSVQPSVSTTKWSSCYGGYISAEISDVDGCKVVWKKDGAEVAKDTKNLKISNVSASDIGKYSYDLVCDGCPFSGNVSTKQPDIYSPLTVSVVQSEDTICQRDEVKVGLEITPSSDKVSYSWSTDNDIQIGNAGASAIIKPFFTKSYNVVIRNGDCAPQSKTVDIVVHPQMNGNIESGVIMCEGDSTTLDASSLEAERYEWGHTDSDSAVITVVPTGVENKYLLTAYRGKCILEKEFILMVGATPKLASVDSVGLDDVLINMESDGEYQFIVDGKTYAKNVTSNLKTHVGFGEHTLTIIDIAGCKTDTSFVIVEPPFEIQKFIIPGSNGSDASFRIPDAVIVYESTEMNIFDRWGKKVATLTSSDTEGWDGTYNGHPLPTSDYWYELNVDAIDKVYVGHFTLIRE